MTDTNPNPNPSQTSSQHTPLEPISGMTLLITALARRETLAKRSTLATGCAELDDAVLVSGGFERGCVVGVSAEDDDVALVLGLQTVAQELLKSGDARAMVVTMMGVGTVVGGLRGALRGLGRAERERDVLGRISVARVFDVFGLWEALGELHGDSNGGTPEMGQRDEKSEDGEDGGAEGAAAGQSKFEGPSDLGEEDEHSEGLGVPEVTPARDDNLEVDHTYTPSITDTPPAHQPEAETPDMASSPLSEPPSSPLSDPPSSIPDAPPWETVEDLALEKEAGRTMTEIELPRRTPPGQREAIQDSEDEDAFSSPLGPEYDMPETTSSKAFEAIQEEECLPRSRLDQAKDSSLVDLTPSAVEEVPDYRPPAEQHHVQSSQTVGELDRSARAALENVREDQDTKSQPEVAPLEAPDPNVGKPPPQSPPNDHQSTQPDIILITHISTLLSSLFHQRDKATAHQTLQLLASHLRYLTRSPEHAGPLIMILNSTTSSDTNIAAPQQEQHRDGPPRPPPPPGGPRISNRPLDPTLRSIFNPPPLTVSGLFYNYDTPHSRRNKPSFGLIFAQMLDMHLLCTKIPKTRGDAEALYAPASPGTGNRKRVEYVWAVEVLLDEMGVWEGREKVLEGKSRRSREQRWGAVQVTRDGAGGVSLVDAFQKTTPTVPREIVLAAGFGGRRV